MTGRKLPWAQAYFDYLDRTYTMADDKRVKLTPERWKSLRDYMAGLNVVPVGEPEQIKLDVMIDVDSVTFLPAVYYPA